MNYRIMQYGMPTLIENSSLAKNVSLCKELGLKFIELNMNFPEYQLNELEKTDLLLEAADSTGIYYTIHLDENLNIADFNELVANAYIETTRRTIEVAKKLLVLRDRYGDLTQPLIINMHLNHGIHITLPDRKVQMYDRDFDVYMKAFEKFRASCEEWIAGEDILVTIENTDGFRAYEQRAIEYLLESDKFGLTWDIGHSKAIGETDIPFLMDHSLHLRHFHIHDGTELPQKNHLALGDGDIYIKERLNVAKEHNCRCVLETKTIKALKSSVLWIKNN